MISGVSNVVNGIAELRNHKGSGHSHTTKIPPPSKIEAQLAVDAAITVVNFFWRLNERDKLNQKQ
ncbi:abortive infection family protein [Candidatus Nanoperiomorbus periodonticus]|uniref:abortive infection family protein n=1 Tax=Candidatus Nanoperiomorbus periodonticus TaxID=2171989 RepID=UPI00101BC031